MLLKVEIGVQVLFRQWGDKHHKGCLQFIIIYQLHSHLRLQQQLQVGEYHLMIYLKKNLKNSMRSEIFFRMVDGHI